jgi:hypothetical protein
LLSNFYFLRKDKDAHEKDKLCEGNVKNKVKKSICFSFSFLF